LNVDKDGVQGKPLKLSIGGNGRVYGLITVKDSCVRGRLDIADFVIIIEKVKKKKKNTFIIIYSTDFFRNKRMSQDKRKLSTVMLTIAAS
jgi:hypothetical protein